MCETYQADAESLLAGEATVLGSPSRRLLDRSFTPFMIFPDIEHTKFAIVAMAASLAPECNVSKE